MSDVTIRNLFIIPTIVFLIVFNIFPLIYSLGYSFTDYRASMNDPVNFVGLQNYRDLLDDEHIWNNFTVTAKYVLMSVVGQVLVGFGVALLLNRKIPGQGAAHDAADAADDDVDGGRRPVLAAALQPVVGHRQLRARPGGFRVAVRSRRGALRDRDHRHLDVVAVRDAALAGRAVGHSAAPVRSRGDRPRQRAGTPSRASRCRW